MSEVNVEYQKQYINLLAKIGEIALIIDKNEKQREMLLIEAGKMYDILSAYNGENANGEDDGVLEQPEESR